MVLKLTGIPNLGTLKVLCSQDAEVDFFNNIVHLQVCHPRWCTNDLSFATSSNSKLYMITITLTVFSFYVDSHSRNKLSTVWHLILMYVLRLREEEAHYIFPSLGFFPRLTFFYWLFPSFL